MAVVGLEVEVFRIKAQLPTGASSGQLVVEQEGRIGEFRQGGYWRKMWKMGCWVCRRLSLLLVLKVQQAIEYFAAFFCGIEWK